MVGTDVSILIPVKHQCRNLDRRQHLTHVQGEHRLVKALAVAGLADCRSSRPRHSSEN